MEQVLEALYEGTMVWIFCIALGLLFGCFEMSEKQNEYVKKNIYEQHMLYGAQIKGKGDKGWIVLEE